MKDPKRKSRTNKTKGEGREGAGNPGPVYGQKDQAPNPREKKATEPNRKEGNWWAGRASKTRYSHSEISNQRRQHQEWKGTQGKKGRGEGDVPPNTEVKKEIEKKQMNWSTIREK